MKMLRRIFLVLKLYGLSGCNALINCVHYLDGLLVPSKIDLRSSSESDILNELVDKSHPLVKVGVLNGISVIGCAVVVDIGAEEVGNERAFNSITIGQGKR